MWVRKLEISEHRSQRHGSTERNLTDEEYLNDEFWTEHGQCL
jgi:hypothetical protein